MTEFVQRLIGETRFRQRRFSRKEKDAFLEFLEFELDRLGISHKRTVIQGMMRHVHLEAGSDNPDIILLAHYDTQTMLPFWVEWLVRLVGHTRMLLFLAVFYVLTYLYALLGDTLAAHFVEAVFIVSVLQMSVPSRRTMNDNTSGVIALLSIGRQLNPDPVLRRRVKLVFTDNEERMLAGSFALKRRWRRDGFDYWNKRIISIDSIGRGNVPVISYNLNPTLARGLEKELSKSSSDAKSVNMWLTPFSDAYSFSLGGAVNINMMERSLIPGGFFIRNIHSPLDKEISADNISLVAGAVCRYVSVTREKGTLPDFKFSFFRRAPA